MASPVDRDLLVREATFWLRPDFVVRCLRRFQALTGFERSIALASLAFTAIIPLGIVVGALLPNADLAGRLIDRFGLKGDGAKAVTSLFGSTQSIGSGFSLFGLFMLVVATLSFARAVQRLYETTWELSPRSFRNSLNGLRWLGVVLAYFIVVGGLRAWFGGVLSLALALASIPLGAWFYCWSGSVLSDRRLTYGQLLPAAILTTLGVNAYGFAGTVYVPELFSSYADRYGAIGVTFALISWLFGLMLGIVAASAVGREVWAEVQSIRRGERPSNAQIEAEWAQVRERLDRLRTQAEDRRQTWRARRAGAGAPDGGGTPGAAERSGPPDPPGGG